ncbi:Fc.00g110810.m01.CDS01 [Cosmosporella sp. VM-42]
MFSFSQSTEPSADLLSGSSWATTAEGTQNFQDFPDNGSAHSGEAEEYIYTSGHTTPRGTRLQGRQDIQNTWTASRTATSAPQGGQAMSRVSSSRSSGSSLSHTSQLSNMDLTGNASAFRNGSQAGSTMGGIDSCLFLESDADAISPQMFWPGYTTDMGMNADATFSIPEASPIHVVPAHMQLGPDVNLADNSPPGSWDCFSSSISRSSSPATIDELWLSTQSPNSSPELQCQSPRYVLLNYRETSSSDSYQVDSISLDRKIPVMSEDLNGNGISQLDETITLPPAYTGLRRTVSEGESARDHDLYKKAAPSHEDGLYHCPWEGQASCNHKPEKLKCNYDKFVDSHLKPYRCKAESCEGARFSSTACLLRHEREAHGLHGHGDKPFLCVYEGCERAVPGNGFPRQWNLRDHMKRVHNDHGSASGSPPTAPVQTAPSKGRKRKTDVPENQAPTSRKSSVKSVPQERKQDSTRPLLDQWMEHRKVVDNLFRGLVKPEDARNIQQINDMQNRLAAMLKVTSDLNAITKSDIMPALSRGTFVGTG